MKEWMLGIWLGIQAGFDLKYKEIPVWLSVVGALIGLAFCLVEKRTLDSILLALIPGLASCLFSKITKEVIGYGDGMVLMVMASFLSLQRLLSMVMISFMLSGIVALGMLIFLKKSGSYKIPLIPFIFIAFVMEGI